MNTTATLIARLGETDQLSLQNDAITLTLERAQLRLALAERSRVRQEQVYFIHEAIVLLEQARLQEAAQEKVLFIALTLQLAKAYLQYYTLAQQPHLALIAEQLLRPIAHHDDAEVYLYLALTALYRQQLAMTRHWLQKYLCHDNYDPAPLLALSAFNAVRHFTWFQQLQRARAH